MSEGVEGQPQLQPQEVSIPSAEKEGIREIAERLKDAKLESPEFQAFADFADKQQEGDTKLLEETIRQRRNGMRGYKAAYDQMPKVTDAYSSALLKRLLGDASLIHMDRKSIDMHKNVFAFTLKDLKEQLIDAKSQQSQPPSRQ